MPVGRYFYLPTLSSRTHGWVVQHVNDRLREPPYAACPAFAVNMNGAEGASHNKMRTAGRCSVQRYTQMPVDAKAVRRAMCQQVFNNWRGTAAAQMHMQAEPTL